MKIGILTYHRSHNYGAMLQAFALRTALTQIGHEVYFIDYWPSHQRKIYQLLPHDAFRKSSLPQKIRTLIAVIKQLPVTLRRRIAFNRFFDKNLKPFCKSTSSNFDIIIYGSDQIWRKQLDGSGYNPVYFGNNNFHTKQHISYAASMGQLPKTASDREYVRDLLKPLTAISVRESDLQTFLTDLGIQNVALVSDPVFLINSDDWKKLAGELRIEQQPYLLFYDLLPTTRGQEQVKIFAKCYNLKVIRISGRAERNSVNGLLTTAGPYEFLNLFKFANFVITSSFHGLVFSLMFHKPFLAIFPSNSERAKSLLESVGIQNRLFLSATDIMDSCEPIDWEHVDYTLNKMRNFSLKWITGKLLHMDTNVSQKGA